MQFPEGKRVSQLEVFSGAALEETIGAVFNANQGFSGYLRVHCIGEGVYFLFFLEKRALAAGKYFLTGHEAVAVRDFFREVSARDPEGMLLSLHEVDPLLLKAFLVFFTVEPTVKAPVDLIDLQAIVKQIGADATDALVVLEADGFYNFFLFLAGRPAAAALSATGSAEEGLPADEQLLLYAYRPGSAVDAYIYRPLPADIGAMHDHLDRAAVFAMLREAIAPPPDPAAAVPSSPPSPAPETVPPPAAKLVKVTVIEGSAAGTTRSGRIPFTIGRKEGDLIVDDKLVSRRHAVIREIDGSLVVEDLGSVNGTFVNGEEVKCLQLAPGDRITLGNTVVLIARE